MRIVMEVIVILVILALNVNVNVSAKPVIPVIVMLDRP